MHLTKGLEGKRRTGGLDLLLADGVVVRVGSVTPRISPNLVDANKNVESQRHIREGVVEIVANCNNQVVDCVCDTASTQARYKKTTLDCSNKIYQARDLRV